MEKLPRISIVTPSYNQAQFLERTIISVLNQNYPNLEYIIIDGGSTDGSVGIIRKYEKYLAYWISETDSGQGDALNKGFDKSTGEILAWLNSDDMYLPKALFKVACAFCEHPGAALVYGDYIKVDSDDRCIALRRQPSFDYKVCLYAYTIAIQPACFFGCRPFYEVGGIDPSYNYVMDYDLILRLAENGKCVHISDYLSAFRFHSEAKTSIRERSKLPMESREMRLKYFCRQSLPGEIFARRWYHSARIVLRMIKEGCLASRFGKGKGDYRLNEAYTPKLHNHCENAS